MEITEGMHTIITECPECGTAVQFPIEVAARLTVDSLSGGKLRPVMSAKSAEHKCKADDPAVVPMFGPGSGE